MTTMAETLQADFDAWFKKLQALTDRALTQDEWTGRWYDGYTPEEALEDGPDED